MQQQQAARNAQLAAMPNPRQYQYGYAPTVQPQRKTFQVIPGAPQWLQNQVGQQQMGWGAGSWNADLWQEGQDAMMANYYAKGEPYTPPAPDPGNPPGGGWDGYGGYGGWGGGGGGGYKEPNPEWYERMINWKY